MWGALFLTLCCLLPACCFGQSLCNPFYIIGESNKGRIWQAIIGECLDPGRSLVHTDEDPRIRPALIRSRRIRKIITTRDTATVVTEYFDTGGYLRFIDNDGDTANGIFVFYDWLQEGCPARSNWQSYTSISGQPNHRLRKAERGTLLLSIDDYSYDAHLRLTAHKETWPDAFRRVNRRHWHTYRRRRFLRYRHTTEDIRYNGRGQVVKLSYDGEERDSFVYDAAGRLLLAIDRTPRVANAATWHFNYTSGLVTDIRITHRDTTFQPYRIHWQYNDQQQLTNITKYYPDGTIWLQLRYSYEGPYLVRMEEWFPKWDAPHTTLATYYPDGLIRELVTSAGTAWEKRRSFQYVFY